MSKREETKNPRPPFGSCVPRFTFLLSLKYAAMALVALALAGCPGMPARVSGGKATTAGKPPVTQKRGGAYYKDDGPADDIPDDLDGIPDARPRLEPLHRGANRPYAVLGKSYVPNATLKPMRQRGVASWYGRKFHGQKTSIGERYDMFAMTAAHPTLALPSYVRVTHLGNGKSVVVRVIDRGPFHAGRIIDLSYAAAHRLGYVDDGSARVEVEALLPPFTETRTPPPSPPPPPVRSLPPVPPVPPPAPEPEPGEFDRLMAQFAQSETAPGPAETPETSEPPDTAPPAPLPAPEAPSLFLQLGAFSSAENAESLRARLSRDLDWLTEPIRVLGGGGSYRVQLGPYESRAEADKAAEKISAALGYRPSFISR